MAIGVPRVRPSKRPEITSTWSASLRWVVSVLWPGRRRSSSRWMSATSTAIPGGMPSTTTPTPGPCDSPKVVTTKSRPNDDDTSARLRLRLRLRARLRPGALLLIGRDGAHAERLVLLDHALELIEVGR